MVEMIDARRNANEKEERHDLFSGLLDAAQGDLDGQPAITEQELIGKVIIPYRLRKRSHSSFKLTHSSSFSLDTR